MNMQLQYLTEYIYRVKFNKISHMLNTTAGKEWGKGVLMSHILIFQVLNNTRSFCIPVFCNSGLHKHFVRNVNITCLVNTGTLGIFSNTGMFQ